MTFSGSRAARLLCVLAAVAVAAVQARAQRVDAISASELRRVQGTRLYEAVAELRPEWLFLGGDTAQAASRERVLVFVDGRHTGDLSALWAIQTGDIVSIRLRSPDFVRSTIPRFPRQEFNAAIFVATRVRQREVPQGRVTLSLEAGFNVRSLASVTDDALTDDGYTQEYYADDVILDFAEGGTETPVTLGGTAAYALRAPWGVALTAQHTLKSFAGGYNPERDFTVSTNMRSTEAALLFTGERNPLRLGIGPVVRRVDWTWTRGFCECGNEQKSSTTAVGVAGEATLLLRLPEESLPVLPQFRLLARYYPSQSTDYEDLLQPLDVGGFVLTMGMGLATRF